MKLPVINIVLKLAVVAIILTGCDSQSQESADDRPSPVSRSEVEVVINTPPPPKKSTSPIVIAARTQVGRTTIYDPAYVGLAYPGGDVPIERGVCTDVVIRAMRDGCNMDLQKLVHEDMAGAFSKYPNKWGLKKPDRNIDHRRVLNLITYFKRKGYVVGLSKNISDYLPGDLVTCIVGGNRPHIMIVSDNKTSDGTPLVIHNISAGTREEDRLFRYELTGHFRIPTGGNSVRFPDPHHHVVDIHEGPWTSELASDARFVPVPRLPENCRRNVVTNEAATIRAYVVDRRLPDGVILEDLRFEFLDTGKIFKIEGIALAHRPYSDLVWVESRYLIFDRWSNPHYGMHYVVDAVDKKVILARPFPDQFFLDQQLSTQHVCPVS